MEDAKVELDRRDFMGLAAAMAAIGVELCLPVATATAAQPRHRLLPAGSQHPAS